MGPPFPVDDIHPSQSTISRALLVAPLASLGACKRRRRWPRECCAAAVLLCRGLLCRGLPCRPHTSRGAGYAADEAWRERGPAFM